LFSTRDSQLLQLVENTKIFLTSFDKSGQTLADHTNSVDQTISSINSLTASPVLFRWNLRQLASIQDRRQFLLKSMLCVIQLSERFKNIMVTNSSLQKILVCLKLIQLFFSEN
uniref:Uncharacterized protein n=1 Tax=Chelydra serpentina TaxID=8475 RepID=A0A8C3SZD8_CHESE